MHGAPGDHPGSSRPVRAIADDLSGAVEVAALLGRDALVSLERPESLSGHDLSARNAQNRHHDVQVFDLDIRYVPEATVYEVVSHALGRPTGDTRFVKIDSMLRGSPLTMIAAAAATGPAVVCPALPAAERSMVGGRLRIRNGPAGAGSDRVPVWQPDARLIDLETVRGPRPRLLSALATAVADRGVPVCDAESDADLDAIVAAAAGVPGCSLIGSGGLAAALGRMRTDRRRDAGRPPATSPAPVLAVVGTTTGSARRQVERLRAARRVRVAELDPDASSPSAERRRVAAEIIEGLGDRPVVLRVDRTELPRGRAVEIAAVLGDLAREAARQVPELRLFLTGGETARSVLGALGVRTLTTVAQLETATVHCRTDDGRDVVTRPGSFGRPDALVLAVDHLGGGRSFEETRAADPISRPRTPTEGST